MTLRINGMTGFGRAEGLAGETRWVWEARSVNGRGLDVKARLPAGREALEPAVREAAQARFKRGSLQVTLTIRREAGRPGPRLDLAAIEALIEAARPYVEAGVAAPPRWDGLLLARGALAVGGEDADLETEDARAALDFALTDGLGVALDALAAARAGEGAALSGVFSTLFDQIVDAADRARALAAAQPAAAIERIRARLNALAPEVVLDPQRLAQEAALIAARADVQEELERLKAHIGEARALLAAADPAGRRLEFLAQELMREANTLSAKSNDLALTRASLDLKTAIDQLKEQAANVE